jgi:hypothetical protein
MREHTKPVVVGQGVVVSGGRAVVAGEQPSWHSRTMRWRQATKRLVTPQICCERTRHASGVQPGFSVVVCVVAGGAVVQPDVHSLTTRARHAAKAWVTPQICKERVVHEAKSHPAGSGAVVVVHAAVHSRTTRSRQAANAFVTPHCC